MKNYYDKVLFLLALIVLGIGVGIFFQKGGLPQRPPIPPLALHGGPYQQITGPNISQQVNPSWPVPPDQGDDNNEVGWVYYVFTPPKIYWDKEVGFATLTERTDPHPNVFGMKFVRAQQELYRIQFQGIADKGDEGTIIDFSDEENENSDFRILFKAGQDPVEDTVHQIKILDLSTSPVQTEDGLLSNVTKVKLLDERTNQEVTLTSGQLYAPSGNRFYILHTEDPFPSEDWKVTVVGDKKEYPGDVLGFPQTITFEVVALDFDKPSVTVVRHQFSKRKVEGKFVEIVSAPRELSNAPAPTPAKADAAANPKSPNASGASAAP